MPAFLNRSTDDWDGWPREGWLAGARLDDASAARIGAVLARAPQRRARWTRWLLAAAAVVAGIAVMAIVRRVPTSATAETSFIEIVRTDVPDAPTSIEITYEAARGEESRP